MQQYISLGKSWEDFSRLPLETKRYYAQIHRKNNERWIFSQLAELDTDWLLVGGDSGKIYANGATKDFLTKESRNEFQENTGEVLFKWVRPPIIDYEG